MRKTGSQGHTKRDSENLHAEQPADLFPHLKGHNRIDRLIELAWDMRGRDVHRAMGILDYTEKLIANSTRPYRKGLASLLGKRGFLYYVAGQPAKGLEPALAGLELYQKFKNKGDIAHTSTTVGILFLELGDTEQAHHYLKSAYSLYQETQSEAGLGVALANMGLLAGKSERNKEATKYYQMALEVMEKTQNKMGISNMLNNLGAIEYKEGRYRESIKFFRRSARINRQLGNRMYLSIVLANICCAYEELQRYRLAWRLLDVVEKTYAESGGVGLLSMAEITRIKILAQKDSEFYDIHRALQRALALKEEIKDSGTRLELMELIPELYTKAGMLHDAIRHYKAFIELKKEAAVREANLRADYAEVIMSVKHAQEQEKAERKRRVQLAKVNRELKQLNNRKDDFLRMIAHDLKTSAVVVQALSKIHITEAEKNKALDRVQDDKLSLMASNHILQLIDNLKDVDSIESRKASLNWEWVDVGKILNQWIRQNRVEAKIKNIVFNQYISEILPPVQSKALYLSRILDNLLSNAIKFSPPDSTIDIGIHKSMESIVVEIRDRGPGIPDKEKKLLFKKFRRLSTKPTMGEASTGLGLYIAKELSQSIGAQILAVNHPDGGAIFKVVLPSSQ